MAQVLPGSSAKLVQISSWKTYLVGILVLMLCVACNESAQATTGSLGIDPNPYVVPQVLDADPNNDIVETWIVAVQTSVNLGNAGTANNAMAFKSCPNANLTGCTTPGIPGPEFRLKVGDRVKVHYVNKLPASGLPREANVSGIHWHGIELNNVSDGTELTQAAVARYDGDLPIPAVSTKGVYHYDFIVTRPGIFWYHPHHHSSTNQVFKGLYGSIIIEDKNGYEQSLRGNNPLVDGVIPSAAHTKTLVLSDITVCSSPGTNPVTFDGNLPHVSGIQSWQINYQNHDLTQSPYILCEAYPLDANGDLRLDGSENILPYTAGEVPNIQEPSSIGRMSEGFTVLTNGVNVGGRAGTPDKPGDLDPNALTTRVTAGQGLRLQIVNPSPVRYMRLRLTNSKGIQTPLVRIGGEGGLLNNAIVEGGIGAGAFDFKYNRGEVLIPPAGRADVVAKISASEQQDSVLTLWTEDFQRVTATWSWTPTVPVMHLKVKDKEAIPYAIEDNRRLLASLGSQAMVKALGAATGDLFVGAGEVGSANKDIHLTFKPILGGFEPSIDEIPMPRDFTGLGIDGLQNSGNPFYLVSSRHATLSNTMELMVTNATGAHHPFHLHGFSFQPISLTPRAGTAGSSYTFDREFRDIVDVPANYTLTFRVSLDDRPGYQGSLGDSGGGTGRWLFHCHILPHATFGMMSELHVH
jgi:FtsP/CotA-like multicopper oxidase with cupredoxin domain